MRTLTTVAAVLLLVADPAWPQETDWRGFRDYLLGPGRGYLMQFCADGRKDNSQGVSYWDPDLMAETVARFRARGNKSQADVDAWLSGLAAAMAKACPSVW